MNTNSLTQKIQANRIPKLLSAVLFATTVSLAAQEQLETFDLSEVTSKGNYEETKAESWEHAQLGNFEILSNANTGNANRLLRDFQKFRDSLDILWSIPVQPLASTTIILCGPDNKFEDFIPQKGQDRNGIFSAFYRDQEKATIIIDLETLNYDTEIQGVYLRLENDYRRQLYREYARFLFSQSGRQQPPWLLEGNLQTIMDIDIYDHVIKFGQLEMSRGTPDPTDIPNDGSFDTIADAINWAKGGRFSQTPWEDDSIDTGLEPPTPAEDIGGLTIGMVLKFWKKDPPFHIALSQQPMIPMEQLLSFPAERYAELNPLLDLRWTKQAHAFVHLCKFGANGKYKTGFETFVTRLANEPLSERLFKECFNMSYKEMGKKLEGYIRYPHHRYNYIKLVKDQPLTAGDTEFRDATQAEIGRIKGDAQSLANLPLDALYSYRTAYEREKTHDKELLAARGVAEKADGETENARQLLEAAAVLGSTRPSAWTTLAQLRLDEANANPKFENSLSTEQMGEILIPLLKARQLQPAIPETYTIMAKAWERSAIHPNSLQIDLLSEGVLTFPAETELALTTAKFYARIADVKHAKMAANSALKHATDPKQRSAIKSFLAKLPPEPAPAG